MALLRFFMLRECIISVKTALPFLFLAHHFSTSKGYQVVYFVEKMDTVIPLLGCCDIQPATERQRRVLPGFTIMLNMNKSSHSSKVINQIVMKCIRKTTQTSTQPSISPPPQTYTRTHADKYPKRTLM